MVSAPLSSLVVPERDLNPVNQAGEHLSLPGTAESTPNGSSQQHRELTLDFAFLTARASSATPSDSTGRGRADSSEVSSAASSAREIGTKPIFNFEMPEATLNAEIAGRVDQMRRSISLPISPKGQATVASPTVGFDGRAVRRMTQHEKDIEELEWRSVRLYLALVVVVAVVIMAIVLIVLYSHPAK